MKLLNPAMRAALRLGAKLLDGGEVIIIRDGGRQVLRGIEISISETFMHRGDRKVSIEFYVTDREEL